MEWEKQGPQSAVTEATADLLPSVLADVPVLAGASQPSLFGSSR